WNGLPLLRAIPSRQRSPYQHVGPDAPQAASHCIWRDSSPQSLFRGADIYARQVAPGVVDASKIQPLTIRRAAIASYKWPQWDITARRYRATPVTANGAGRDGALSRSAS